MTNMKRRRERGESVMAAPSLGHDNSLVNRVWLLVLGVLAVIVATGCIRMDFELVVHGPDEVTVNGRVTMSPVMLSMMGGVEGLEESFTEDLDPSVEAKIESVSDNDGWRGDRLRDGRGRSRRARGLSPRTVASSRPRAAGASGCRTPQRFARYRPEKASGSGSRFRCREASNAPTARASRWVTA